MPQHLLELVRASSMDAVVLLAHERVHDPDGTPRDDLGSMYVPNDVVLDLARKASGISRRRFDSSGALAMRSMNSNVVSSAARS